jgi:hypothetical protein
MIAEEATIGCYGIPFSRISCGDEQKKRGHPWMPPVFTNQQKDNVP